jgi:tetratricopeptide (TPR) repeat protein
MEFRAQRVARFRRRVATTGRGLFFVLTAFLTLFSASAYADEQLPRPEAPEALAHFETGNKAFRSAQAKTDPEVQRREFEEAIKHYRAGAAIETRHIYTFYWNLGHAYRQLGEYTQADWFYRKFLALLQV